MMVKSSGEKQLKLSQIKKITDIKNVSSQKDKKGNYFILFHTKLVQSKEVLDFILNNKDKHNIEEINP